MTELKATEPGSERPIPSKRLDQDIREAVSQYNWESDNDDPLLRAILLCRARSTDWAEVLRKAMASYDQRSNHQRLNRHLFGDTPGARQYREELYLEMTSRLIDPTTLQPVDITRMGPITLAREVADGNIQIEYVVSTDDASRERI